MAVGAEITGRDDPWPFGTAVGSRVSCSSLLVVSAVGWRTGLTATVDVPAAAGGVGDGCKLPAGDVAMAAGVDVGSEPQPISTTTAIRSETRTRGFFFNYASSPGFPLQVRVALPASSDDPTQIATPSRR